MTSFDPETFYNQNAGTWGFFTTADNPASSGIKFDGLFGALAYAVTVKGTDRAVVTLSLLSSGLPSSGETLIGADLDALIEWFENRQSED